MLKIVRSGFCTSIQDLGRFGLRNLGISYSGAVDTTSMILSNILLENSHNTASIEIILGQVTIKFEKSTWISLCGANCNAMTSDKKRIWNNSRQYIQAGQLLILQYPQNGVYTYLSIPGGIRVSKTLGSCSTDFSLSIGGKSGRKLYNGDRLYSNFSKRHFNSVKGIKSIRNTNCIRAIKGPEYDMFDKKSQDTFWNLPWKISLDSNRMGYRLKGETLKRKPLQQKEMLSHGVLPGVIQVSHNGQPIVLMNDSQITGGYPRIACIIEVDIYQLVQLSLGRTVYFVRSSIEEAVKALKNRKKFLRNIEWIIKHGKH